MSPTAASTTAAHAAPGAMPDAELLAEIREANLTLLLLAQNLIRRDRAAAQYRLGLSEEAAELLQALSPAQLLHIASGNMLLCRFRIEDDLVWELLTQHKAGRVSNPETSRLHAAILMASRVTEAA